MADPTTPNVEALLHISALAFALTLAYVGLDKVEGGHHRKRLDDLIKTKENDFRKLLEHDDLIGDPEELSKYKNVMRKRSTQKSVCMLTRVCGQPCEKLIYSFGWRHLKSLRTALSYCCVFDGS